MLWFEGRLSEGSTRPFDLTDRGLTLGDGVFDTALCLGGRIAFVEAHLARLAAAAESLGFSIDHDAVRAGLAAVAGTIGSGSIRTTVTRGSGPRGLGPPAKADPVWWIGAAPRQNGAGFAPVSLWPAGIRRNETSPASRLKTLGYLDAILAAREARAEGFDEALFLNTKGHVACAGTGNLFVVLAGRLVTPPLSDGVLPGIVRGEVIALARSLGHRVEERSVSLQALESGEGVFMTNSLRGLSPVTAIGRTRLPAPCGLVGEVAAGLRLRIASACDVDPAEP